jgi:hypothetical protein
MRGTVESSVGFVLFVVFVYNYVLDKVSAVWTWEFLTLGTQYLTGLRAEDGMSGAVMYSDILLK